MKHNHTTNRVPRSRPRGRYAEKHRGGKQMYSQPGYSCCGHTLKSTYQQQHARR